MHLASLIRLLVAGSIAKLARSAHQSGNHDNKEGFVYVKDGAFYKHDSPYYIVGMNYWNAMGLAASAEAGGNISRFETEVAQMAAAGINNLRVMAASEGSQYGIQPFRMVPPLLEAPSVYNEDIFQGLDRSIATFAKYNITAVMTLQNFWQWSGGYSQYVSWATNTTIPYPPSWDPTLNPPYGDYSTNGSYGYYDPSIGAYTEFQGYAGRFYNDSSITNLTQSWFQDHIKAVINRRNTVTGVLYKDDPTIMTWELTNEPQDPPLEWVETTAEYIKRLAPKQLVTVGFEGKQGEWWFKRVHTPSAIDYACGHLWVQNWGYYEPTDSSDANFQRAMDFGAQFLSNLNQWSLDLGKPVVLEEFGMARDEWENVEKGAPTNFYLYDASAGVSRRDVYFQAVISGVVDYWKAGGAWFGTAPWAYAGIWRPFDARNQYNEAMGGGPPHEPPGWYDIYDDDYAMEIIAAQASNVTAFISAGNV